MKHAKYEDVAVTALRDKLYGLVSTGGTHRAGAHALPDEWMDHPGYRLSPHNVCNGRHCLGVVTAVQHRHEYMPYHRDPRVVRSGSLPKPYLWEAR